MQTITTALQKIVNYIGDRDNWKTAICPPIRYLGANLTAETEIVE
jgi:hypothetical protein